MSEIIIRRECADIENITEHEGEQAFLAMLREFKKLRKKYGYSVIVTCDFIFPTSSSCSSSISETSVSLDAVGSVSLARPNESDCSESNLSSSPNESLNESPNESPNESLNEAGSSGMRNQDQSEDTIVWKPANTRQQDLIKIGESGRTWMKKKDYDKIKFKNYKKATRTILMGVFGSRTLATHTRSGKTCPIYKKTISRKVKPQLPEVPLNDIKIEIRKHFNGLAEELINESITTKCADEGRKYKNTKVTEPED